MPKNLLLRFVPLGKLRKNPFNPRRTFDPSGEDALRLEDMAQHIKKDGILLPVVVRPWNGGYQMAAGERRRMAAELAGLKQIPAVVRRMDDETMRRYAVVENVHRLDLTDRELEDAIGRIWEQDYESNEQLSQMASDLGMNPTRLRRILMAYKGRREKPSVARPDLPTRDAAMLTALAKEAPKEARQLAEARAKGALESRELDETVAIVRAAPKERRPDILEQVRRATKVKVKARRELEQTLRESDRYAREGPKLEWRRMLSADERLFNRVVELRAGIEKFDMTYLELFQTLDQRLKAVKILEAVRDNIDRTLTLARKAEPRWRKEWTERRAELEEA
ncbi:MAG: ParB/RepB/Spo0J family partition protein [Candidatus Thermoplasmatota archaeon]|nr:ParB/RepB/Spo0J family partition protein [Candidatus Thermoplasmatota archaeon]